MNSLKTYFKHCFFVALMAGTLLVPRMTGRDRYDFNRKFNLIIENKEFISEYRFNFYKDLENEKMTRPSVIGPVFTDVNLIHTLSEKNGLRVFRAEYNFGNLGQRIYLSDTHDRTYKKHLIVAGDSNTFGEGCNNNETLDFFLQQSLKDHRRYNYSFRGGGPNNILALFENFPIEKDIKEKEGIMINSFYTFLFQRTIGSMQSMKWNAQAPYYALNDEDQIEYRGPFSKRPLTYFYNFLNAIPGINYLIPELPQIHDFHIHLIAKMYEKTKSIYLKKFPKGRFVVVIHDYLIDNNPQSKNAVKLMRELKGLKIEAIYFKFFRSPENNFKDLHISPHGHELEAKEIVKAIKV